MSLHNECRSPPIRLHHYDRFGCFREAGRDEFEVKNEPGKFAGGADKPANLLVKPIGEYNLGGLVTE